MPQVGKNCIIQFIFFGAIIRGLVVRNRRTVGPERSVPNQNKTPGNYPKEDKLYTTNDSESLKFNYFISTLIINIATVISMFVSWITKMTKWKNEWTNEWTSITNLWNDIYIRQPTYSEKLPSVTSPTTNYKWLARNLTRTSNVYK
jgi:hypothetical protein